MKTIGIIGAMEEEIAYLKSNMELITSKKALNLEFFIGILGGINVVLVHCGIGKVNAAVCTNTIINEFAADAVINLGVAGSINPELGIADIVLSRDTVQHDFDASKMGYTLGTIPRMPISIFEADEELLDIAEEAAKVAGLEDITRLGRVASADKFVADNESKKKIWSEFKADCAEMEGAAIAQAAYLNQIPFLIVRSMSDNADDTANHDYDEFLAKAIENPAIIVLNMLKIISEKANI